VFVGVIRIELSVDEVDDVDRIPGKVSSTMSHPRRNLLELGSASTENQTHLGISRGRVLPQIPKANQETLSWEDTPNIDLLVVKMPGLDRPWFNFATAGLTPEQREAGDRLRFSVFANPQELSERATIINKASKLNQPQSVNLLLRRIILGGCSNSLK